MARLTYRDAGVDVDAGERLVDRIAPLARRTMRPEVQAGIGGFAALCAIPPGYHEPLLVSGTDGVGTKLRIAFLTGRHGTIGIDLVAMCANDVAVTGAEPLFFLDYFASSRLDVDVAAEVVAGIAEGCRQAGCALVGGETAELPGFYAEGEYDLAGFCVGVVERARVLDGRAIRPGDRVLGVASSGLHSNGYSLARRALLDRAGLPLDARPPELGGASVADELLRPTRIYARAVRALVGAELPVRGCAHVTGGGLIDNPPRVLPDGTAVRLHRAAWREPPIFDLIRRAGDVEEPEMRRTFNLGLGLIVVVADGAEGAALATLAEAGERATVVGEVVARGPDEPPVEFV